MKFSINRQVLIKHLSDVQRAISSRTTIPILTGVKISADENGIVLSGSDSDISIETLIPVSEENNQIEIHTQGGIVLPARFFSEIVKKLADEKITIEVKDHFQTNITSAKASFTINGIDVNNYPNFPVIDSNEVITLPTALFKQVIQHTVIATSTQESRPILTGVNMTIKDGKLTAVATDSHRLSQRMISIAAPESQLEKNYNVIIPGKSLVELSRIVENQPTIEMMITENQVLFKAENVYFYSRLLEGYYPDTNRLIPASSSTQIVLNAYDLLQATDRASLLSHEGKNNVVKLSIDSNKVELSGNSPEVGNVEESLAYQSASGDPLIISFNPDYMKDALRTFGQQDVQVNFTSAVRPFTVVPADREDENDNSFIQLITPVRTY
ncbi:DNA polymerase-3 subunit beta [Trichococcus flocculiformis]|uniref:DNA polymerase III subunit beta n=1 Tax=Trichococcus TaxID=82802 RepID=UPI0007A9159C|nr:MULTISPECIES: DNA polymerase III subunit beta [Trichococcus]CZR06620.1 dna polymerase iii beta chain central [Trichococcus sp. ES5]SHF91330.1 DNA polymerase-3 subunit beta [Trichococcus flocculiformis]